VSLRVAALTGGAHVPSARFRVHQHRRYLATLGIDLDLYVSRVGMYPPANRMLRPPWLVATLADRVPALLRSRRYDVTLLQRELVSTFATLESWSGRPRVLDVDDALWLHRGGRFIRRIARSCDRLICGNAFLADYFTRSGAPPIDIIPTAVDTERFRPLDRPSSGPPVIGWTGLSSGFGPLYEIEPALADVLEMCPEARLRVVADRPPAWTRMPPGRVEYVRWTPVIEADAVRTMTVGLMPLRETDWDRGKCSYKMLQYMACGLPVVVSPVGMNRELLGAAPCGYAVETLDDWRDALLAVLRAPDRGRQLGCAGRRLADTQFSVPRVGQAIAAALRRAAGQPAAVVEEGPSCMAADVPAAETVPDGCNASSRTR
jgi:glycosyltransferase involved in cell wall biosynthesis